MTPRKSARLSTNKVGNYYKCKKTISPPKAKTSSPKLETLEDELVAVLAALRNNTPASLPGRSEHIQEINKLLKDCIDNKQSCSVYIYGAPGHGKTASVQMIANQPHIKKRMKVAYIDCRKLMTPGDIYETIILTLNPKYIENSKASSIIRICELIERIKKPILLILDEIDRLKTQSNSVLYSLLELRSILPAGKIAIIGVGNAQNFMDTLPLMKDNDAVEPLSMEFGSYTKDDIREMLLERLNSVSCQRLVFTDTAIELIAAKTAVFGDARVPLGLASSVVESLFDKNEGEDICKVGPLSVVSAFNVIFGQEKTAEGKDAIDSLTIPQRLILCSIVMALNKKFCATKDLNLTHVYSQYKEISTKKAVDVLPQSEFLYACHMIDQQGFFTRKKSSKKSISWNDKILLKWDLTELLNILKTKPMLSDIFSD